MLKKLAAVAAMAVGLAGCATDIAPLGGRAITDSFEVAVDYQEAWRRADEQMRQCLRGENGHSVRGGVDDTARTAVAEVITRFSSSPLVQADIQARDGKRSAVSLAAWNVGVWNEEGLAALRESIEFGTPTCRAYMPKPKADPKRGR
ncbi:BPTD_2524 family lipoprotein [Orrella dioscoreae]|uniref:Putative lipoprotein n=1 Tax=Orrella dioscoreae TaxID=1851544 RepID=A0A1C3K7K6_9BURK|nr:hypothetical protein [Orrella dioscoreae]SBT27337.1 putative lipoprotein [Orrella dioscoreae]SOE50094.1 putative lipoprotein [Orrella dioscoreae]